MAIASWRPPGSPALLDTGRRISYIVRPLRCWMRKCCCSTTRNSSYSRGMSCKPRVTQRRMLGASLLGRGMQKVLQKYRSTLSRYSALPSLTGRQEGGNSGWLPRLHSCLLGTHGMKVLQVQGDEQATHPSGYWSRGARDDEDQEHTSASGWNQARG